MYASRKVTISKQKLLGQLGKEGCQIVKHDEARSIALVPGWDQYALPIAQRWPIFKWFWDRIEITSCEENKNHRLSLRYWSPANIAMHLILTLFVLLEGLGQSGISPVQLGMFLVFVNALLPSAAWLETNALYRRLLS